MATSAILESNDISLNYTPIKKALKLNKFKNLLANTVSYGLYTIPSLAIAGALSTKTQLNIAEIANISLIGGGMAMALIYAGAEFTSYKNILKPSYWKGKINPTIYKERLEETKKILSTLEAFNETKNFSAQDYKQIASAYALHQLGKPDIIKWLNITHEDQSDLQVGEFYKSMYMNETSLTNQYEMLISRLNPAMFKHALSEELKDLDKLMPVDLNLRELNGKKESSIDEEDHLSDYAYGQLGDAPQYHRAKFILDAKGLYPSLKPQDYQAIKKIITSNDFGALGSVAKLLINTKVNVEWGTIRSMLDLNKSIKGRLATTIKRHLDEGEKAEIRRTPNAAEDFFFGGDKLSNKIARSQNKSVSLPNNELLEYKGAYKPEVWRELKTVYQEVLPRLAQSKEGQRTQDMLKSLMPTLIVLDKSVSQNQQMKVESSKELLETSLSGMLDMVKRVKAELTLPSVTPLK